MIEVTDLKNEIERLTNIGKKEKLSVALMRTLLSKDCSTFINEYMRLIDYDLDGDYIMNVYSSFFANREELSQDYTPQSLGKLIATMANENDENIHNVLDLCCGSGSLTLEFNKIKSDCMFYMIELDSNVMPFLLLNLAIRGINADVINGNGLSFEFEHVYQVRRDGKYSNIKEIEVDNYSIPKCDVAISNPPFNVHYKDEKDYSKYCGYKQTSYADALFAINCLENIKEDGKAYYITFPGVCYHNDSTKNFRQYAIESGVLVGIIRMPQNFFVNTGISVDLWVFDKDRHSNDCVSKDEFVFINNVENNYTKNFFTRYKRGSFGGKCHENRVYEKKFNGLSDDNIRIIIDSLSAGSSHIRDYVCVVKCSDMDNTFNFGEFLVDKYFDKDESWYDKDGKPTKEKLKEIKDFTMKYFDEKWYNALMKEYYNENYNEFYQAYVDMANYIHCKKIENAFTNL